MKTELHEALSHGLRTPLTSVLGFASTLLDQWDDLHDDERVFFLQTLYSEALRMAESVEQVDQQLYHGLASRSTCSTFIKQVPPLADAS